MFRDCCELESIVIPDGVTSISDHAFQGCISLKSITIPEGVTSIGDFAFDLTEYRRVPGSVGQYVNDNPQLEFINIPSTVESLGNTFLRGLKENGETMLVSQLSDPAAFTAKPSQDSAASGISLQYIIRPRQRISI